MVYNKFQYKELSVQHSMTSGENVNRSEGLAVKATTD